MRLFFRRRIPPFERLLLVESGSRRLAEDLLRLVRRYWGDHIAVDLVTCYAGLPRGFDPANTRTWNIADYPGRAGRKRLYAELTKAAYPVMGVICSAEPIMTKWKWALAAHLPSKLLIVNENADFFWFDYGHWRISLYFFLFRAGLAGPNAVRNLARLVLFPFTLLYLLLYAGTVHLRRAFR